MPIYHFQLTPHDTFFFGDERSFNSDDNANYFVRSRYWPQQTTLLGSLRYELLRRAGLLAPSDGSRTLSEEAAKLVGPRSFEPDHQQSEQAFGRIKRLSPVWVEHGQAAYVTAPLDQELKLPNPEPLGVTYLSLQDDPGQARSLEPGFGFQETADRLRPWVEKDKLVDKLCRLDDPQDQLDWEAVFKTQEQVGIIKQGGQDEDTSGFYRQQRYRLAEGWYFGFYAEIEEDPAAPDSFAQQPVSQLTVGGEKAPFRLEATPMNTAPPGWWADAPTRPATPALRLHLLSDALISRPDTLVGACQYAVIGEPVDFRAVQTAVGTTQQFHNLTARSQPVRPGQGPRPNRAGFSSLYQLLPRGSVLQLAPEDWETVKAELLGPSAWRQIGYNAFQWL